MDDTTEYRKCDDCDHLWRDTGDIVCPECGSDETFGGYDAEGAE